MKLMIFGATGGTGRQLVEQALAAGHEVTAVVRRPDVVTIRDARVHLFQGDVLQAETFKQQMAGQDAVLSALGTSNKEPTAVYSQGLTNIIAAMLSAGVRRLICVTASGLDPGPRWQQWVAKPMLWRVFKEGYTDMVLMETIVRNSGLDWTIVRPPRLTDGARTGQYNTAINQHLKRCWQVSRADLAGYMLTQISDRRTYCGLVEIAY